MAGYSLSEKASQDVADIYEYSILNFGLSESRSYLMGLEELFRTLAQRPALGRSAPELAQELRRFEYRSHVVFFRPRNDGVRIERVLHRSMDVESRI